MIEENFGPTQVLSRGFDEDPYTPIDPNNERFKKIMGLYGVNTKIEYKNEDFRILTWGRMGGGIVRVATRDGYLTWNGNRCHEYLPGLFFQYTGEALDFRGTIPTARNIMLIKRR